MRRTLRTGSLAVVIACGLLAACDAGGRDTDADPVAPRGREDPDRLADELAPSQVTASTVARPDTPPSCAPGDIVAWTASVDVGADRATAVVRLRNDGEIWCEIDLRESPRIDPRTEPDLWLEPGEWGDLWIGADESTTCEQPQAVVSAEIAVRDQVRSVPTAAVVPCEWTITAMYGVDSPERPCEAASLAAVRVGDELVVRNTSFVSCSLGPLVDVDGVPSADPIRPSPIEIGALAAGDTVAFPLASGTAECAPVDAEARFDSGAEIAVPGLRSCDRVALGPGGPFYDGADGPLAGVPGPLGELEFVAALAVLDPFAEHDAEGS